MNIITKYYNIDTLQKQIYLHLFISDELSELPAGRSPVLAILFISYQFDSF